MAEAFGAFPELRNPFEPSNIHPEGSTTILYQGRKTVLSDTGEGEGLLVRPEDLPGINGFELKPEGACFGDICIPLTGNLMVTQDGLGLIDFQEFLAWWRDTDWKP